MGSRATNAFPEQSSPHDRSSLSIASENMANRRTRVTARAYKKRQEPIEPRQDTYELSSTSQPRSLDNLIFFEDNEGYTSSRAEGTSTRIRTRRNKRTQDMAELDEPGSSTSYDTRPNKRRAISEVPQSEPIIILPLPRRSDSPHITIRRAESDTIPDDTSYSQPPFNSSATGNNTGGVTLPPISLPQEHSTHSRITLPPIRSVLPLGIDNHTERSRTPEVNSEIEVVDLTSPAADPYPSNVVDLTSPNIHPPSVNSSYINSNINNNSAPEVIVIDDDSSVEDPSSGSPLPPRGLQLKCAICLDYPTDVSTTSCGHIFCRECISTALKSQKVCSLCRHPLTKKHIKRLEFKILEKKILVQ